MVHSSGGIRRLLLPACLAVAALLVAGAPASAWEGTLLEPEEGRWGPESTVRVLLPESLEPATLERLALELDGFDVTSIAVFSPRAALLRPPRPLTPGGHTLRLLEYLVDGTFETRGLWEFVVPGGVERRLAVQATAQVSSRAADGDVPEEYLPKRNAIQGSLHIDGGLSSASWETDLTGDLVYQTPSPEGLDAIELGEFLARAGAGPATLRVGHHALPAGGLLMRDFSRRGVSLEARLDGTLVATGFALRSGEVRGFRDGLGIHDPESRVAGAQVGATPFAENPELLQITGAVLNGRQEGPGEAVYDPAAAGRGDGWSLGLDSALVGGRLRLHGEYARTRFTSGGEGDTPRRDDQAFDTVAAITPFPGLVLGERPLLWELGLTWQRVGTDFRSLANPGLPSDLETRQGFTRLGWGSYFLETVVGRVEDNVAGLEALPRSRSGQLSVQASAGFLAEEDPGSGLRRTIGTPRLALGYQQGTQSTVSLPDDWAGGEVDSRTREWNTTIGSSYERLDWSAGRRWGRSEDHTGAAPETRSDLVDAGLQLRPWTSVDLSLLAQRSVARDISSDVEQRGTLLRAECGLQIVPGRLRTRIGYQVDRQESSDGASETRGAALDFDLEWTVVTAEGTRPGLSLWVRGRRERLRDAVFPENDREPYQVFVGGTVAWAGATP